jgi:hypothetical protein
MDNRKLTSLLEELESGYSILLTGVFFSLAELLVLLSDSADSLDGEVLLAAAALSLEVLVVRIGAATSVVVDRRCNFFVGLLSPFSAPLKHMHV